MTRVAEINKLVRDALAAGVNVVEVHHDTYAQHVLRVHPNVCRQALAGEGRYALHNEPCGCPPAPARVPKPVARQGSCCGLQQPVNTDCWICGQQI